MNIFKIVRPVFNLVSSATVGTVIGNMVKATTPSDLGKLKTFGVHVGGFILSATLSEIITDRADKAFFEPAKQVTDVLVKQELTNFVQVLQKVEEESHRNIIIDQLVDLGHLDSDTAEELKDVWGKA